MKKKRILNEKPDFIKELEARQRNIWMGDQIRNSLPLYRFFWNGSPTATVIQRIGLALFGLVWLSVAFSIEYTLAIPESDSDPPVFVTLLIASVVAFPFAYVGYRFVRNAFRR